MLIHENGDVKHVMLWQGGFTYFDFEICFRSRNVRDLVGREILAYMRSTGKFFGDELYERLMDEGRVRRMPVDRITDVMSSAVYGTMFTNYFSGRTKPFERQAADLLEVVFHGILAPGAKGLLPPTTAARRPRTPRR